MDKDKLPEQSPKGGISNELSGTNFIKRREGLAPQPESRPYVENIRVGNTSNIWRYASVKPRGYRLR